MVNVRKNFKWMAFVVLALAALTFVRVIWEAFSINVNMDALPEGATAGTVLAAQIVLCVVSFILLLPQIYVGVKGMKIAEKPDNSKAHIIWATILAVISIIGLVSPVSDMLKAENVVTNVVEIIDLVTDVVIYIVYIGYAKLIRKAA